LEVGPREVEIEHAAVDPRDRALEAMGALAAAVEAHVPQPVVDPHVDGGAGVERRRLAHERVLGIEGLAPDRHGRGEGERKPAHRRPSYHTRSLPGIQILPSTTARLAPVTDGRLATSP